ncbi:TPA: winged helix-turn-helix domain-containing protein [Clostridioides difficile]|nr:winged helix-turn-helix domain-containing protein [Clostridioides difficile]HDJ1471998.1 winged helix-turn-helix domain-containing protein [Clostridioides difficile]
MNQQNSQELIFNSFTRSVVNKNGDLLFLTSKEFDLLYFLYLHKGQVFTKEQLYEHVWGFENMPLNTSNLPSFIRKLRKKIEPDPDNPIYIITVWGVGYKFSEEKP